MLPQYNWSEDDWVALGPGSTSCIRKMFGKSIYGKEDAAIRFIRDNQFTYFACFGLSEDHIPRLCPERDPGLTMVDIEHALCECEKYSRSAFPNIKGRRSSAGRVYVPNDEPVTADVPTKWRKPLQHTRWKRPAPVDGKDTYEVSHIVKEAKKKEGIREYHVRWMGWPPEDDWILCEDELHRAGDLVVAWNALKQEINDAMQERAKR